MKDIYFDKPLFEISHSLDEHPKQNRFTMHAHEHYELLLFISGDVTYLVEGELYKPKPYDLLIFNIAETHKVLINSDTLYERTVVKMDRNLLKGLDGKGELFLPFSSKQNGKNNLISSSLFPNELWRLCLENLQVKGKSALHYLSDLTALLNEICNATEAMGSSPRPETLALQMIAYVNDRITEPLVPEKIAKLFFISKTTLYTLFKKSTGTTFHEYIVAKRLIIARELLRLGHKPTYVAPHCGFPEYTTFYRLYKKRFGESPKHLAVDRKSD